MSEPQYDADRETFTQAIPTSQGELDVLPGYDPDEDDIETGANRGVYDVPEQGV